jgi:hypothetical protein
MTHTSSQDWTTDHTELCRLAAVLLYTRPDTTPLAVLEFFERPWKWEPEHQIWVDCGRPDNSEDAGWESFVARLDAAA